MGSIHVSGIPETWKLPLMELTRIFVEQIFATIQEINKKGVTVLLVEQNKDRSVCRSRGKCYVERTFR